MIFFTSDLHLSHENAIKNSKRPFKNAEEMNQVIVNNWNARITEEDEVYILGDFTLKGIDQATEMLSQLKGTKYLVRGNHDRYAKSYSVSGFQWVKDYHELKYKETYFILTHYPILSWNGKRYGSFHFHGHIHTRYRYNKNNIDDGLRRYDVGVDANRFTPISIEDILQKYAFQPPSKQAKSSCDV